MSKKEKVTEQKEQKALTKYDLKMQKREEQKKKEKREKLRSTIITVVMISALVGFIISFPIRTYLALNETYITVNGEEITRVEFDYNYNLVLNEFLDTYGDYMSYFLDANSDLSKQTYNGTLSWKDYFDQMAVEKIMQSKALLAEANAAGFTYDTTQDFADFEENIKASAAEAGVSVKTYVQQAYGPYATLSRISEYIKNDLITAEFYNQKTEELVPTDDEIQTYYESNASSFDSVDYRVESVRAEIADGATEEEIKKAMEAALAQAKEVEATIATEGELQEGVSFGSVTDTISGWLFEDARKEGDTTVIEDTESNLYYILAFEKRYLNEEPTVDVRMLVTATEDGQTILDEWKAGEATSESFGKLCEQYSTDSYASVGGLREGVTAADVSAELAAWMFDSARVAGDTIVMSAEGESYLLYFVAQNDPAWKLDVKNTLVNNKISEYMAGLVEGMPVEDPKGKLKYLTVEDTAGTESTTAE